MKKIVITGGGTGGHVFPALAIADEMAKRGYQILYVGTENGMEAKLVPEKKYPFFTLKTGSVKNQGLVKILKTLYQLFFAVIWSIRFLKKESPAAVVGVGGYVSFPICFAAFLLRLPLFLQEQNASVGIANRVLGRFATQIFMGFEGAKTSFPARKCVLTGNPLRENFYRTDFPPYNADAGFLLIMGGSQGALAVNQAIIDSLPLIKSTFPNISILHQTGKKDFERVKDAYSKSGLTKWEVLPFITDVEAAYAKSSIVIARSGALTVSELIQIGRPAIFVPFPRKGQNDQTANAYLLEKAGVARVVEQGDSFSERLWKTLQSVYSPEILRSMSAHFSKLRTGNALVSIADLIEKKLVRS